MREDKSIQQQICELEARIQRAINHSSGSIEDESRIDDLHCALLELEEQLEKLEE